MRNLVLELKQVLRDAGSAIRLHDIFALIVSVILAVIHGALEPDTYSREIIIGLQMMVTVMYMSSLFLTNESE